MAYYRNISLSFWTDSKVEDTFTPEDKYMYLYLLTNPYTNICGCYEISIRQISRQIGYNEESVERILYRLEHTHKVIVYHKETKELLIINWGRYNWTRSEKLVKPIMATIAKIKHPLFRDYVTMRYENIDTINTVSIPYPYGTDTTVSVTVTVSDTDKEPIAEKTTQKKETENRKKKIAEGFDEFWSAYPRKTAKANALKAFEKLNPDGDLMKIMLGALSRWSKSEQWTKDNGQFIPHASTWLNGRRWEDELPQSVQKLNAHGLPPGYSAVLSD